MTTREAVYSERGIAGSAAEPPSGFVRWVAVTVLVSILVGLVMIYLVQLYVGSYMRDVVLHSAVEHSLPAVLKLVTPEDLAQPMTGERYQQVDNDIKNFVLAGDMVRLKLWGPSGTVVYSNYSRQVGESRPEHEPFLKAMQGTVSWEMVREPESPLDMTGQEMLEVYVPLFWEPGVGGGVLETVIEYNPYAVQMQRIRYVILAASAVVLLTMAVCAFAVFRAGSTSIRKERDVAQQRHREVVALNRFLQADIERTRELQDRLQSLRQEFLASPPAHGNPEALAAQYVKLSERIGELAAFSETLFRPQPPQ